jgi:hypothetical protein
MAGNNVGTTLLSVIVAIGAFVASNIWSQGLHETIDRLSRAMDTWNVAYNAVSEKEIDLKGDPPSDLPALKLRLQHRLEHATQLEDATTKLMQAGVGTLQEDEASIKMINQLYEIQKQSQAINSVEQAVALDNDATHLLDQLSGRGVLRNVEALQTEERTESRETYVKYAGYSLSILAIIVAAIAQLT